MNIQPKLFLPAPDGTGNKVEVLHNGSVVIVGANGSGKSRLGAWIEKNTGTDVIVHRISAQRALDLPDYAVMKSLEQSNNDLLWGNENPQYANQAHKWNHRWGSRPETYMQNDYGKVLSTLFARSADRDKKHTKEARETGKFSAVPDAPIDALIKLWNEILPHRTILLDDGKVSVKHVSLGKDYHGKEMSDGERVALYLMGQCLCAPAGSILVIDEPELHLHSSIMQSLWDKLEEAQKDCLFVYITHDLNFASTRVSTTSIWVKEFDGASKWSWEAVPEIDEFPESLLLELLGNRRTVVFVEGEKGGKDHAIYQSVYRTYHVVPRSGCQRVIESARALRLNESFHHISVFGLIDRDFRTDAEIQSLANSGVHCIDVAEIENILLNENTLRLVAKNQLLNPDDVVARATTMAIDLLKNDIERQASLRTYRAIENRLSQIDTKPVGLDAIKKSIADSAASIDVDAIFAENVKLYTELSTLNEVLKYYNNKGLVQNICSIFELGKNGYEKLVLRMLNSDERDVVLDGLRQYVPTLNPGTLKCAG
ncbi:MAG: AAA family ATPase [Gammaproteobacteria bacterium]|nr:AAA family ATPase [Gammaproteobacteria bacterium]